MDSLRRHGIFFPLLLIAAGVVLFLNNLGQLPGASWDAIFRLWPVLLIVAGLDGFWRGRGYAGATVVTGLGVIFLMGTLGVLTVSALGLLLRLWPLFLVAIGLDILLGQRRIWSPVLGILIGLAITAGVFLLVVSAPQVGMNLASQEVNLSLNDASTANGKIVMAVGKLGLSGGAQGGSLVTGSVSTLGGQTLVKDVTTSGGTANFQVESRDSIGFIPFSTRPGDLDWKLQLNAAPSYTLNLKMAVGEQVINLTGLKVTELDCQAAVGKTQVNLPAAGPLTGRVQMAVGQIVISVPRGTPLRIRLERALTATTQPPDFKVNGQTITSPGFSAGSGIDLTVNQAIGSIVVEYAQ